jgi:hypothetical protein
LRAAILSPRIAMSTSLCEEEPFTMQNIILLAAIGLLLAVSALAYSVN